MSGSLEGHGHVSPRSDGARARCGGPGLCAECSREASLLEAAREQLDSPAIRAAIEEDAIVGTYPNGRPKFASVYAGAPSPRPTPPRRFKERRRTSR